MNAQTDKLTNKWMNRPMNRQINEWTDRFRVDSRLNLTEWNIIWLETLSRFSLNDKF